MSDMELRASGQRLHPREALPGGSGFPDGPWDGEPDVAGWRDEVSGLACLMVRNFLWAWCGYVMIPQGHPLHGCVDAGRLGLLDVHGGVTWAGAPPFDQPLGGDASLPDGTWCIGFDCSHMVVDYVPGMSDNQIRGDDAYKTVEYARSQTNALAQQIGPGASLNGRS